MKRLITSVVMLIVIAISLSGCGVGKNTLESLSKNISTYTMDIVFNDEEKTLNVYQKVEFINEEEVPLSEVYFHLYPKSFNLDAENKPVGVLTKEKAYYNGESEGDIVIEDIKTDRDCESMVYMNNDEDILKLELKDDIAPRDKMVIEFNYEVVIPNCNHRFGYGENTINLGNFYPVLAVFDENGYSLNSYNSNGDPFYSDMANYNVNITAPQSYKIASTGVLKSSDTIDGVTTSTYEANVVRDFAFVLSSKFEVANTLINGVNVMYYYYEDDDFEKNLQASVDALITFEELFGEYPYSTLSIVKTNFVHGGMEYPNLVYISDEVTASEDYINVIIHEIAHQWWYGLVGNDAYVNSWLDEGLTEFSTLLFYENNPSYNVNSGDVVKNITKSYSTFVDIYSTVLGEVDTSMNRKLNEYPTEPEYVYVTYVKGNLFFNSLRETVGKSKFNKSLKEYFESNKFKIATPDHLLGAFEKVTKMDLSQFFKSWIEGKVDIVEP